MRIATLDCFAGISGDMFLGALLDAGVPVEVLERATAALGLGATLRVRSVDRSGITATKVDVMEGAVLAEDAGRPSAVAEQVDRGYREQPKTQHLHKAGQAHTHDEQGHTHAHEEHKHAHEGHPHAQDGHTHTGHSHGGHEHGGEEHMHAGHGHGRSLSAIRVLIGEAALGDEVKEFALRAFALLGESEAKIHDVPVDEIHFHEVGAVDAIVDIVGAAAGVAHLRERARAETGAEMRWHCSALNVGSGMVQCAHGNFPVPAPATADLLRGMPTYAAHVEKEMVTPTGAALVRALAPSFEAAPVTRVSSIGYGAGSRDPKGFANVLRLSIGEAVATAPRAAGLGVDTVVVLETAIDDLDPQVVAYVLDLLLERGALDVMSQPVGMKKGRQGTLLTVLAEESMADALEELLLRETSTLGVRRRTETRSRLERTHVTVETSYGAIRVKRGSLRGEEMNARPEFEDCRRVARERGVPLKRVMDAAMLAYGSR